MTNFEPAETFEAAQGFDIATVDKLLTTTRAVRKRLDPTREVPRALLTECINLAIQAPAGGNIQRWRWLVVDDEEKRAKIAEYYAANYAPYIEAQRQATNQPDPKSSVGKIMSSSDHLAEHLAEVPVHVIPCNLGAPTDGGAGDHGAGWWGSIVPAVWSFMLAARSRGLGTAYTTLHLPHAAEVGELLGIPDTVTQVALIPTAYYTGDDFKPGNRRGVEDVTYWNSWKNTTP